MAEKTQTIGSHQELHIGPFKVDRRGLISGSVQRHRKEPFDKIDWNFNRLGAAPPQVVPCVGVERVYNESTGYAIYTYSYEGITADPVESQTTFELDITMEEAPIESHPNLAKIEAKYGKFGPQRGGRMGFPPTITAEGKEGLQGPTQSGATLDQKRNPLGGTDSFYVFGATFRKIYVRRSIPANALRGLNTIVSRPIGVAQFPLPPAAKHRKWLKATPKITVRGNCVQIEENFILGGKYGWVKEIYSAAALSEEDGESGGSSSALTSGGLTTGSL